MHDKLAKYTIIKSLATGGVAEIFLARLDGPGGFSRPAVIKRLRASYRRDPSQKRALIAEARVGALLDHPGILQYWELVEQDGEIFIVTEYLHGVTARRLLRAFIENSTRPGVALGLFVVGEVLAALDFAHNARDERGQPLSIVHRDVSPENVMLCHNGAVKLLDFGIARTAISPRDTQIHMLKGKVRYFSPEQALGRAIGTSTDVYAAGLLLYELICTVPALDGDDEGDIIDRARRGEITSIRNYLPELPASVTDILDRALARDVAARYPNARAMMRDVRVALQDLAPGYSGHEVGALLAQRFSAHLDALRRQIWRDQSTQVVQLAQEAQPSPEPSRPRYAPSPAPRRDVPSVFVEESPTIPVLAKDLELVEGFDTAESIPAMDGEAPGARPELPDLEALRRAITEAYDE